MKLVPIEEILSADRELYRLVRSGNARRVEMGEALEALASAGGHGELGFVSVEAYARERCDQSGRWAADLRSMARRLEPLPLVRQALLDGKISWSMAELVTRRASADDEEAWLRQARTSTVRQMREKIRSGDENSGDENSGDKNGSEGEPPLEMRTLTITMSTEEAWFFEATGKVLERLDGRISRDEMVRDLLAEGHSSMLGGDREIHVEEEDFAARTAWLTQLGEFREEAEKKCERQMGTAVAEHDGSRGRESERPVVAPIRGRNARDLDARIRRLARELSERDVAEGMLFETLRRAEAWRRLSYASQKHYVQERLGVSLTSLKAKRALAVRAAMLPQLRDALVTNRIGQASARLISRVAAPGTVTAWIERAERRTVKHLREEVQIAEMIIRNTAVRFVRPPSKETVRAAQAWEARGKRA